ncbi:MAG: Ribonuclease Z [Methanosaeta sp. PtaB.Bin039]|nr:MAG: Ribonuclease Z [Methanosaeta sp. PtaB.Bin039]OPY45198.1 MAG: Ribonuclease Z [Methanosaeta sp. PtaU1.Bin028]HQF16633.1 ribonuclease Z [Methanotrichaceae archaeon]HQI91265.1 ribonuclease Z [Methanotrichaceae archaeon]HQJ61688.1 ribonuclease Z [Methanothrix soehngenii]
MLQIIFLGTAGSLPTPERNPSAILINREGELVLFDCGEGTQRQMMKARTGMMRLGHIFLTHLHADHFLGIPGLLETMAFQGRTEPLVIAGPVRTSRLLMHLTAIGCCSRSFEVQVVEMSPGDTMSLDGYRVIALRTEHSVPSLGYCLEEDDRPGRFNRDRAVELGIPVGPLFGKLQRGQCVEVNGTLVRPDQVMGAARPGRRVVYSGDTRPVQDVEDAARGADVLIHDGALGSEMAEWAKETRHSTVAEAADLASRAGVALLVLTHISSRYSENCAPLLKEALQRFAPAVVAEDLMKIDVPLRE